MQPARWASSRMQTPRWASFPGRVKLAEQDTAQKLVEDPGFKQRFSFEHTVEARAEVLLVEVWVDPGGGVPPHVHPAMEERFHVLEGRPSFLAGRTWREAGPGEEVVVPPGVRHAFRNRSDAPAHTRCDVRPPSSLQEFLEETAALS